MMKRTSICLVAIAVLFAVTNANVVETMIGKLRKWDSSLKSDQISNARAIMTECQQYTTNVNQLAYILSTAFGESGFRPIKEIRARAGTKLHTVQNKYWGSGYFGRGYVQITWDYNYKKFGEKIGVNLLGNPDLALRPDIAGKIICYGMAKGAFTGKGLNNYFSGSTADWTNARRIINGVDKASIFGERARKIANA